MNAPSAPPRPAQANPNLSLVLHWLTEVVILGALWVAALQRQIPTWMAIVASGVIGGWVPVSMVLQVLGVMGRAQLGQFPSAPAAPSDPGTPSSTLPSSSAPSSPSTPSTPAATAPIVPPPLTAFLAALALSALHRGHAIAFTFASSAAGYALTRALN